MIILGASMRLKFWQKEEPVKPEQINKPEEKNLAVSFLDILSGGYSGSKTNFYNGFGLTTDLRCVDVRTLQFRSLQLMRENSYANTVFTRLLTKTINTGLTVRSNPAAELLSGYMEKDDIRAWTNKTERLFSVWGKNKDLVSFKGDMTFDKFQRLAYKTALISGDCLIIVSAHKELGTPVLELVDGINVYSPDIYAENGNEIKYGVEIDSKGRQVAYYVETSDPDNQYQRVKAYSNKGRQRAWLISATESRVDDVRGLPILSVILQNINELGKYLDSEQRAALVNSYIAVVHQEGEGQITGLDPLRKGAKSAVNVDYSAAGGNSAATFNAMQAGFMATRLAPGETIKSFDTSRPNVNFGKFAEFILKSMAHSLEIPPEMLFLEFNSNYSASRQAVIQFDEYARKAIQIFVEFANQPIFEIWLDSMVLNGMIDAPGYVNALQNIKLFPVLGAWRLTKWRGLPKTNADGLKQAKENEIRVKNGWNTNAQIADEQYNTDFEDNVRELKNENEMLYDAIPEEQREIADQSGMNVESAISELKDLMIEIIENKEVKA